MKTKSKLVLGLSILSAATLAAATTSTFAWFAASKTDNKDAAAVTLNATTQSGWSIWQDNSGTAAGVAGNAQSITIGVPAAELGSTINTAPALTQYLDKGGSKYEAASEAGSAATFTFYLHNENATDADTPNLTITIGGAHEISSNEVICWVLVEDTAKKGNSAYTVGALAGETLTQTSKSAVNPTGLGSVNGGAYSAQYTLYVWADGQYVTEANRASISAVINVAVE